ncbi:MAG: oligosaccharide flippase family protein [Flavobacteriales bacterium]|nr:oligosaccharide flippase family protein [Flavobacteriales bacterium]
MQRKFINNLIFILFLNLLVKPFWILGIDRTVQNKVGAEEYGLYASIFGFAILLNIILDFGITNYNNRNIAQHSHMLRRYFSGIFNVKLILGIIYLIATLLFGLIAGYEDRAFFLLFVLSINQIMASMVLYLRSNITGLHLFKTEGILSIMDRVIMIILCSILLWSSYFEGEFEIEWFAYAQTWAYLITLIIAFVLVYMKAEFYRPEIDIKLFRIILKQSLPFALLVLLMSFYYRLDVVMIERLLPNGRAEVGIYSQAYRLLEGFNMFGYLFAGLLLPTFSRMLKNKEHVGKLVSTSFNLIFIPAMAVATISFMYSREIMDILYLSNIDASAEIYQVLMISFVAIALTYIYGTLLTANGSLKQLNIVSFIGMLVNLGLNFWLIPKQGAYGAAVATLVTQAFVILAQIIISKRTFGMPYEIPFILRQSLLVLLACGISYYTKSYFSDFKIHAIAIMALFGGFALVLGLIRKEDILKLVKKK